MMQNQKNSLYLTLGIAYLLIVGTLARFHGLAWHFSHADDIGVAKTIFDAMQGGRSSFWAVPETWTYAPLQFLITPLLINLDQSYREVLFWGRLPSCIFSILSLCLLPLFYQAWKGHKDLKMLVTLALMVFSWEHIINAKQMHNFSFALLGLMGMLYCWAYFLNPERLKIKNIFIVSLVLATCALISYQLIWFYPAFFGSLFIYHFRHKQLTPQTLLFFLGSAILLVFLISPIYFLFLKKTLSVAHAGVTWNKGPHNEFLFNLEGKNLIESFFYGLQYYATNTLLVLQNNLSFVSNENIFRIPIIYYGFGFFFIVGIGGYFVSKDKKDQAMLFFLGITAATWIFLISIQKTTLSPTRHTFILLPFFALLVSTGFCYSTKYIEQVSGKKDLCAKTVIVIIALMMVLWAVNLSTFFKDRRDPFVENEIAEVIEKYKPDTVIALDHTINVGQMKFVRDFYDYFAPGYVFGHEVITRDTPDYQIILWISHRTALNQSQWQLMIREKINHYLQIRNMLRKRQGRVTLPYFEIPFEDFEILYQKEISSDVEVDYSNRTKNGTNGLFMYVLKRKGS